MGTITLPLPDTGGQPLTEEQFEKLPVFEPESEVELSKLVAEDSTGA